MPWTSMPPSPGNSRSNRAVWMSSSLVGGTPAGASQTWAKWNHCAGQFAKVGHARARAGEVQQVDEDAGVGLVGRPQHPGRLAEIRRLRPRRKLEVDREAQRPGHLAQLGEPVDLAGAVGVGQLRDDVPRAELGAGLQEPLEVARVLVGADPGQLDVENLDPGRGQTDLGRPHQGGVGSERIVRLLRGDPGQAQARRTGSRRRRPPRRAPAATGSARSGGPASSRAGCRRARSAVSRSVSQPALPVGGHADRCAGGCAVAARTRRRVAPPRRRPGSRASRCRSAGTRRCSSLVVEDRVLPHRGQDLRRQAPAGRRGRRSSCRGSSAPARRARAWPCALAIASSLANATCCGLGIAGAQSPRRSGAVLR